MTDGQGSLCRLRVYSFFWTAGAGHVSYNMRLHDRDWDAAEYNTRTSAGGVDSWV